MWWSLLLLLSLIMLVLTIMYRSEIQSFIIQKFMDLMLEKFIGYAIFLIPSILSMITGVSLLGSGYQLVHQLNQLEDAKVEIHLDDFIIPPSPNETVEPDFPPIEIPPENLNSINPQQEKQKMAIQEYLNRIAQQDNGIDGCIIFSASNGAKLYWSTTEGHGKWLLNADAFSTRLKDAALRVKQDFSPDGVLNMPAEFRYSIFIFDKLGLYVHVDDKYIIVFANGQGLSSIGKLVEFAPNCISTIKDELARLR